MHDFVFVYGGHLAITSIQGPWPMISLAISGKHGACKTMLLGNHKILHASQSYYDDSYLFVPVEMVWVILARRNIQNPLSLPLKQENQNLVPNLCIP